MSETESGKKMRRWESEKVTVESKMDVKQIGKVSVTPDDFHRTNRSAKLQTAHFNYRETPVSVQKPNANFLNLLIYQRKT